MNRRTFNAIAALTTRYAAPEVSGNGLVRWEDGKRCVIPSVRLYGAAMQDGTPTPEAPVMPVCNNGVFAVRGSNLLNPYAKTGNSSTTSTLYDGLSVTKNGLTAVVDGKGNIRVTGTHTYAEYTNIISVTFASQPVLPAGTYTAAKSLKIQIYDNEGKILNKQDTFTVAYPFLLRGFYITYHGEGTIVNDTITMMLNAGDTILPYEPYCDGGQAQAPELWAIPGTAYRDEWDAQTGRGIRRCAMIGSYVGEAVDTPYISSTGALTAGATVVYGIPDTPFYSPPARLTQPRGFGQIFQTSGDVADCPIVVKYLKRS